MKKLLVLFVLVLSVNAFAQKDGTYMDVQKVVFEKNSTEEIIVEDVDRKVEIIIKDKKIIITNADTDDDKIIDSKFDILSTLEDCEDFKSFIVGRGTKKYNVQFDFTEEIKAVFFRDELGNILVGYMR